MKVLETSKSANATLSVLDPLEAVDSEYDSLPRQKAHNTKP